jgi:hypothetical protein
MSLPCSPTFRSEVWCAVKQLAVDVYEVEFSDDTGKTYATAALRPEQIMVLRYEPAGLGS